MRVSDTQGRAFAPCDVEQAPELSLNGPGGLVVIEKYLAVNTRPLDIRLGCRRELDLGEQRCRHHTRRQQGF